MPLLEEVEEPVCPARSGPIVGSPYTAKNSPVGDVSAPGAVPMVPAHRSSTATVTGVLVAALVTACELRAGAALVKMTEEEGLNLAEAVEWCGGADLLTAREAARLRQAAQSAGVVGPGRGARTTSADAGGDGPGHAVEGDGGSGGGRAAM